MVTVKIFLFLGLSIQGRHFKSFEQHQGWMVVASRGSKHDFGSIVSQLTELGARGPSKECICTGIRWEKRFPAKYHLTPSAFSKDAVLGYF